MIYEIMYIIPSQYSDSEVDGIVKKIDGLLEKAGAEMKRQENLGKIKFAYPIKKVRHGTYILNYVEMAGEAITKLDQDLRLSDEVLRHIIIKREEVPTYPIQLTEYMAPITPEGKRAKKSDREKKAEVAQAPVQKPEPTKVDAAELDKKLDAMLESDMIDDV